MYAYLLIIAIHLTNSNLNICIFNENNKYFTIINSDLSNYINIQVFGIYIHLYFNNNSKLY